MNIRNKIRHLWENLKRIGNKRPPKPEIDLERVDSLLTGIRLCTANPTTRNVKARERHIEELVSIVRTYSQKMKEWEKWDRFRPVD